MDDNGRKEDTNNFDVSELQFSISTTINETDEEAEGTSNEAEGTSNEAEGTSNEAEGTSNEAEGASTEAEGTTEAEGISIEAESTATKSTTTTKVVRRTVRIIAKDKFEWYEILYKKLLILKASKQDDLIDFLDQYLFKIRIQTLSCSTKPRLAMTLSKNITNMLHLVKERNVRFGMNPSYLFKVSEVMAVYIDMELKASTRGLEAGYLVANRIIFNLESHLEAFDDTFIIESFLRITRHWKTHKEIINMLLSRYLYRSNTTATIYPDRIFLTYMILFKKWRDMTIHSVDKNRIANKFVYFIKPMNSIRNCKYTCYLPDLSLQQDVSKYLITVKFFIEQLMRALKEPDESEPPTVEIINIDENIMNVPSNRDKLRRCSSNANVLSSRSTSPESGVMLEDINKPSTSRCILSSNTDPIASSSKSDFPKPNSTVKKENIDSLECIVLTVEDDDITNGEFNYDWLEILTTRARDNLMMPPRSLPQSRKENRKNIEIIDLDDSDDETEVTPSNNLVSPLEPLDSVSANINQEAHTSLVDCQTKIGTNDLNNDKEIIKNKIPVEYTDTNIELNENANIGCLLNETVKGDITLAQTDNKIIEEKKNIDRNVLEKCNNEDISVKYSQIDTINKETENSSSMEVDETNITLVKESDQPKNNIPNCKAISENQIFQNDPDPDVSLDGLDEQTIVDKAVSAGIVESTETTSISTNSNINDIIINKNMNNNNNGNQPSDPNIPTTSSENNNGVRRLECVSYPATPMLSIASLEFLPYNITIPRRHFKTPAQLKEMTPINLQTFNILPPQQTGNTPVQTNYFIPTFHPTQQYTAYSIQPTQHQQNQNQITIPQLDLRNMINLSNYQLNPQHLSNFLHNSQINLQAKQTLVPDLVYPNVQDHINNGNNPTNLTKNKRKMDNSNNCNGQECKKCLRVVNRL